MLSLFFYFLRVSGCTDYFAEDERSAFALCRDVVSTLNVYHQDFHGRLPTREPLLSAEDLPSIIPSEKQYELDIYQVSLHCFRR